MDQRFSHVSMGEAFDPDARQSRRIALAARQRTELELWGPDLGDGAPYRPQRTGPRRALMAAAVAAAGVVAVAIALAAGAGTL
jgi:hypothetical protein